MTQNQGIEQGYSLSVKTTDDLFYISRAFEYSRALHLANDTEVFTKLSGGPLNLGQLSQATGVESGMLDKILIVMAAMDLLITDGDRFSNGLIADRYLVKGKPDYIGDALWLTGQWWARFNDFSNKVLEQSSAASPAPDEQTRHDRFIQAMHDYASTGDGDLLADALNLAGIRRLIDIGGGPGTYAAFLCRKYCELTATVFDLPDTERVFRQVVDSYGMADRIAFQAGDMDTDDLGSGYDAALVSNVMHGSRGESLPPKVFAALNPGGLVVIRDFMLNPERNGPMGAALFNMRMGAYTEDEMIGFLQKAGFVSPTRMVLGDSTIITARRPS